MMNILRFIQRLRQATVCIAIFVSLPVVHADETISLLRISRYSDRADREAIVDSLIDGTTQFGIEDIRLDSSVIFQLFSGKIDTAKVASLISVHAQWKAVDSILLGGFEEDNVRFRMCTMFVAAELINQNAANALILHNFKKACAMGDIDYACRSCTWLIRNSSSFKLQDVSLDLERLIDSFEFEKAIVDGPSGIIHSLLVKYRDSSPKTLKSHELAVWLSKVSSDWKTDRMDTRSVIVDLVRLTNRNSAKKIK